MNTASSPVERWAEPWAERWRAILFWIFWLYIVLFAVGPSVREVLPTLCGLCLIPYYAYNWKQSSLRRFKAWWLFLFFAAAALWGVVTSQDVWASFLHVGRGVNKAFLLPFVAMECVRDAKDLRRLIWAMVLACLWQGCNGIWQSITGFDFVDRTAIISGRLTGSLSDYRVGNFIALMLIPAAGVYWLLKEWIATLTPFARNDTGVCSRHCEEREARRGNLSSSFSSSSIQFLITLALLGPALYLLYFSYTRNGYLTVIAGMALYLCIRGISHWKTLTFAAGALLALKVFAPHRFGTGLISSDGRWELWRFAWDIFCDYPFTGAGFWQYNTSFRALGHAPTHDVITMSHPHNIYLQLLCESGIVGLSLMLLFLLGILIWGHRRIVVPLRAELSQARIEKNTDCYWRLTALLWCAWGAYLVSGIVGHDFFRIWWQALVMTHLGIMIGAIVQRE